jgi:LacI family transcriptional regulator
MQKRIGIKDIAEMSGVSIGTVDRVLHNRGEVNRETYDRVMSFVRDLGYTPNLLAKSLALKRSFSIAVLVPEAGESNTYWEGPLDGIRHAMAELKDFNTKISVHGFDPGNEQSFILQFEVILAENPDGIIFAPHFQHISGNYLYRCEMLSIPVILIDTDLDSGTRLAYFGQDARQSGHVAARLIHYSLPEHSTILIINLARNRIITPHMQRREQGFVSYFNSMVPDRGIKHLSLSIDLSLRDEPESSLREAFSLHPEIEAIFVTNSRVHKVARTIHILIDKKIPLIGYDLIEENLACLEDGTIDFLICQKPEEQGYLTAMVMNNHLITGKPVDKVNFSPIDIVVKENAGYYKNRMKSIII